MALIWLHHKQEQSEASQSTLKPHVRGINLQIFGQNKKLIMHYRKNTPTSNKLWITFNISKESPLLPNLLNIKKFYVTTKYGYRFSCNGDSTI